MKFYLVMISRTKSSMSFESPKRVQIKIPNLSQALSQFYLHYEAKKLELFVFGTRTASSSFQTDN